MIVKSSQATKHLSRPLVKSWNFLSQVKSDLADSLVKNDRQDEAQNISQYDNRRTIWKISLPSPQWAEFQTAISVGCSVLYKSNGYFLCRSNDRQQARQTVSLHLHYKGTELDRIIGQTYTQHVWKVLFPQVDNYQVLLS